MGVLCSAAALGALHLLQPERAPATAPLGAYALGAGGLTTVPVYLGLALALTGAAIGSLQTLGSRNLALLAAICLGIGAVATATAGVFPSDGNIPPRPPASRDGWIHLGASVAALPFYFLGPLLFTHATRGDPRWNGLRAGMTALVVGLGGAVGFILLVAVPLRLAGAGERALASLLLLWLVLVGQRLRVLGRRTVESGSDTGADGA